MEWDGDGDGGIGVGWGGVGWVGWVGWGGVGWGGVKCNSRSVQSDLHHSHPPFPSHTAVERLCLQTGRSFTTEQQDTRTFDIQTVLPRLKSLDKQNLMTVSEIEAPGRLRRQKVLYCRHFQASPGGGCTGARKSAPEAVFTY